MVAGGFPFRSMPRNTEYGSVAAATAVIDSYPMDPSSRPATRRQVLAAAAALVAAPFINRSRYRLFAQSPEYSARAVKLVEESLVIDMLDQFLYRKDQQPTLRAWLAKPGAFTEADFARFKNSGINAINFGDGADTFEQGIRLFAEWNSFIAAYPDWLLRIGRGADFEKAKSSGRYGILFGLQNAAHFRRPEDVDTFYGLGQRVSQLTYNFRNLVGNGAFEPHDDGISEFGARIVARMNEVRMAVDCGHAGDHTMLDAFSISAGRSSFRTAIAARSIPAIRAASPTKRSGQWPSRAA